MSELIFISIATRTSFVSQKDGSRHTTRPSKTTMRRGMVVLLGAGSRTRTYEAERREIYSLL